MTMPARKLQPVAILPPAPAAARPALRLVQNSIVVTPPPARANRHTAYLIALVAHVGVAALFFLQPKQATEIPVDTLAVELMAPPQPKALPPRVPTLTQITETAPQLPMPAPVLSPWPSPLARTAMPSAPRTESAATPTPAAAPSAPAAASEREAWIASIAAQLEHSKRYPRAAKSRGLQGVAIVRVRVDRNGNVLSAQLERSAGSEMLDEEASTLAARAQPLPAAPAMLGAGPFDLLLPVSFRLN
ncbi:energy transducer TonB [Roseiterribacter gracilis]|uniref:Protein TonB n=1 Tax=Roseiterribacter gracilis TaxID=2812848 RepID=A0A8S8XGW2_9PROT|nr:protein TonB [Rhodospirillales bacterium TMPK1]